MTAKSYYLLWLLLTLVICYEYLALHYNPAHSGLHYLTHRFVIMKGLDLSTDSGKPIGYYLGWVGFGFILLTNFYIFRKRSMMLKRWGRSTGWLEFHIFCGLLGPTLIVFHSNFKVNGLVAVSFWSMIIVAVSGVVGRYFYVQVLTESAALQSEVSRWERAIQRMIEYSDRKISDSDLTKMKNKALRHVGAKRLSEGAGFFSLIAAVASSLMGDFRLLFSDPRTFRGLPRSSGPLLCGYALAVRRKNYNEPFKTLLGYWHSFHLPFAVVMYIAAIFHIAAVLILKAS
jgi:hypothetical protein